MPRMTAKLSSVGISPAVIPWTDNVSLVSSENDDRSRRDAEVPGLRGGMEPVGAMGQCHNEYWRPWLHTHLCAICPAHRRDPLQDGYYEMEIEPWRV